LLKIYKTMKIPNPFQRKTKKLQAATRAMPKRGVDEYEEPSMKFSNMLVVVVLLHLVAVGGVYAFSSIKERQRAAAEIRRPSSPAEETRPPESAAAPGAPAGAAQIQPPSRASEQRPAPETSVKPAIKDSGQVYTVARGDNPVTIARRLGVSYDELLRLNKIDDPKKLQIGQKLRLPPKIRTK
jgi:nucleoid-associated protein YgaU